MWRPRQLKSTSSLRLVRTALAILLIMLNLQVSGPVMAAPAESRSDVAVTAPPGVGVSYKMVVEEDGLYRLTYATLAAAGVPVDSLDPRTLKVWEQGQEIAIIVQGENDGVFNSGDAVLFYGKMARTRFQDPNVYWLTYGGTNGKRMTQRDVTPGSAPTPVSFYRTLHLEQDLDYRNSLPMEANADHWYWESYAAPYVAGVRKDTRSYDFDLPNLATGSYSAVLRPRLRGITSYSASVDHHAKFYVNSHFVGDAYWDGEEEFTGQFTFPQSFLITGTNTISYFVPADMPGAAQDRGLTNWLEVEYYDVYQAENDRLWFTLDDVGTWQPTVGGFSTADPIVLDINDPRNPVLLTNTSVVANGAAFDLSFQDTVSTPPAAYFAAASGAFLSPTSIVLDTPSDLKNPSNGADWIAITHADFMTQAQQLAAHRAAVDGYRTVVVDVQDIYDEFSGGLLSPEAIRDFLAYAYNNWTPPAPRYVVLVGDGNYDYKNNLVHTEKQFIPPYLDLVDCFLGETSADNRFVAGTRTNSDPGALECQKHAMPFMAIGRLPVNTVAEADGMVRRIICYETPNDPLCAGLTRPAGWDTRAVFVADKNDSAGAFSCHADEVAGQQRCPDQDYGFKPAAPRVVPSRAVAPRPDVGPLAVVGPQVTDRMGFIGDLVWNDQNSNGWPDASEPGINGVVVKLWEDRDGDGTLSAVDTLVATVVTGDNPHTTEVEQGWYGFDGLAKAHYLVEIDASNFAPGGALEGMALSHGQNPWPVDLEGIIPEEYTRIKLYREDESSPGVVPYPNGNAVKTALVDAINSGAAFVTYNGHASTWKWSGADVFDIYTLPSLTNTGAWPVVLPMTCLEGQFQNLYGAAVGESVVRALDSSGNPVGAVASWSPTGLGVATGHTFLYTGFFEAVFHQGEDVIGDAILYAKRKLFDSSSIFKDLIETYTLFGDPAMHLNVPRPDLQVTKSVTPGGGVLPGDVLTYTLTVDNIGAVTAYDVVVTDTLPATLLPLGWTGSGLPLVQRAGTTYIWDLAELPAGGSGTITVTAQVPSSVAAGTQVVNTVTVFTPSGDSNPDNNSASVTTQVGGLYTIDGVTWVDSLVDQVPEPGEPRLENVTVSLYQDAGFVSSAVSGSDGVYTITNVSPGTYTVTVTVPTGYVATTATSYRVTVVDSSVSDINFGFISPTVVAVVGLSAVPTNKGVQVSWRVRFEDDVQAYMVYRSARVDSARKLLTLTPIAARHTGELVTYTYLDRYVGVGVWYYWIKAISREGLETWFGPVQARYPSAGAWRSYVPAVWQRH